MDPDSNRAVVGAFLASLNADDPDAPATHITDDFVWHAPKSTPELFPGSPLDVCGLEGLKVMKSYEYVLYDDSPSTSDIHCFISEGDRVVFHTSMTRQTKAGLPYSNDYVFLFQVRDGKVAQVWEMADTLNGKRQYDARP